MSELHQLLESFRAVGEVDSSSRFALDAERAQKVLDQYRLPGPGFVAVKLVQGLVGLGANSLSLRLRPGELMIDAPGASLPDGVELAQELAALRVAGNDPVGDLVIGLRSSLGQGYSLAACSVRDGPRYWLVVLESGLVERFGPMRLSVRDQPGLRIHLGRPSGKADFWHRFRPQAGLADEHRLVSKGFVHCPIPLELDGRKVNRALTPNPQFCLGRQMLEPGSLEAPSIRARLSYNPELTVARELSLDSIDTLVRVGPERGWAWLTLPLQLEGRGTLTVIRRGYLCPPKTVDLGPPGASAVVVADHLATDLSQISLREDAAFDQLVEQLRARFAWLTGQVLHHFGLLERGSRREAARQWRRLAGSPLEVSAQKG